MKGLGQWRWHLGAVALYAALAWCFIDHGVSITHMLAGQGSDPYAFVWFFTWWPYALAHHLDPLFTRIIWQPTGVALSWVTSVPLLTVPATPFTDKFGAVPVYNLCIIAAPVFSAWFAYRLCLRITANPIAALIGGYIFGFSAYEMGQDTAALNLSFSFFLPALLWVVLRRLDDEISRIKLLALAAPILLAQFLMSIEIFALIFLFGGIAWLFALRFLPARRAVLRRLFFDGLALAPFVAIPLSPLLWQMYCHRSSVHLPEPWPYFYDADLLNIFIPGTIGIWHPAWAGFHGGIQEEDAYIGLPLLLLVGLFARQNFRLPEGRFLITMFLVFLIASLGPFLWVGGHFTGIALPWLVFLHLPLMASALPARFALFVSLVTAIIAAIWVARPNGPKWRLPLALLGCLALLPRPHAWEQLPDLQFFKPGVLQAALGPQPRILILPFSINGPSSYWQAENRFGFSQTGGYLGFTPAAMQHFTAQGELFGNVASPDFVAVFAAFCRATATQYVVEAPGANPVMVKLLSGLDWPVQKIDDVTVLTVPAHMTRLLSLVVPFYNEAAAIQLFYDRIMPCLEAIPGTQWELVCVDDGSSDGTLLKLVALAATDRRLRVIEFSRNFGKEAALTAGIDAARGAAVIPIDADLQDPPELIAQMVAAWEQGAEVVLARRGDRATDGVLKRKTAAWFYRLHNRMSKTQIPENVGDFRLMDRIVVDALKQLPERQRFMKGLFAWVGFHTVTLDYARPPRAAGTSKFSGFALWNFALEGFTSFSTAPLKIWTYVGAFSALCTFLYAVFIVLYTVLHGTRVPGYASLLVAVLFFGSVQLMSIGLLGEYIGRIYIETKQRPGYLIRKIYGGDDGA